MNNRLLKDFRAMPFCVVLCLFLLPAAWLRAQPSFFNFSYNGPTSLPVGPTCSSMLQGNVPDPVVTSTIGATITMSMFDPVASMFQYNDLFTTGTTAHVYWFVKDNAGHSHTFEYFISFVDLMPPMFNLTGIFDTLEFSSIVAVPPAPNIPVVDNCTPVLNQTFNQTPGPDTCQSGTFTRTWTATDANNNTAIFTQTIIIYKDSLPPQITGYPLNGSAPCQLLSTAYPAWLATQISAFAATDASGVASLTNNAPVVFPPGCKVPLAVRFKAVDNCAFQQNVDVTFSTSDSKGPIVVKAPRDTVAYCSQSDNELTKIREWINKKAYSQAFDSCSFPLSYIMKIGGVTKDSAQVVTAFLASFAGGCKTQIIGNQSFNKVHGFVSVDFFVQDACGNQTFMGNADFGAIDTLPPVITGINATEQCGGANDQTALQAWINAHGNAMVTEDCSDFTWTNFSFVTSTGQVGNGNFNAGPYPTIQANNCSWFTNVTFRATDDCGNSSTITLRWSIIDTQAPTFTGLQPNITVYCPNPLPTVPAATVSDNCDANVTVTFSRVYKDSLCNGSYTVLTTWAAIDDCGNLATTTQNIFVRDTTRPVFTLIPPNQSFRCDTFVLPPVPVMGVDVAASDGCSPVVSITTATNSFQNPDPAVCGHYTYNIVRTFTATDQCGNTQTATQTIFVMDNLGPVPGGVLDTTALCSALQPFPAPLPIATDACSGLTATPIQQGQSITVGPCTDQYTIVVQWVATDVCGNLTTFDQRVHVFDTVAPTLVNIPPNDTVECDAIPTPPNTLSFNPADNCDVAVTVTLVETEIRNPDTTNCAHWTNYTVKREWTATDNCGNSRTYTQLIKIKDTTPPLIVPPPSMMFPNDAGDCGALIAIPGPLSITDVCSEQLHKVIISDMKPLIPSGPGSLFVVPVASMSFQLNSPNTAPFQPAVNGPVTELRVRLDNADANDSLEFLLIYDENNTLIDTLRVSSQCGDKTAFFPLTPIQLNTWLMDGMAKFTVVPNGTGPGACNPVCNNGMVTVVLEYYYADTDVPITTAYSVDGGASQSFPPLGTHYLTVGTHTVIYTATDCVGNSSTASVQILINDTQAPILNAPPNITVFTGQNNCEGVVMLPFPGIIENCAMSASLSLASAVLPLQFEVYPDVGLVASDIPSIALTGVIPNAVGTGILKIRHKGDNALLGEYFKVYDEAGADLDTTTLGTLLGECSTFHETIIPVNAADINTWAQGGGNTSFYLEPNRNFLNYSNFIGNCAPLLPNNTDGVSMVQVVLEYSYAVVDYSIKNAANQVVSTGTLIGNTTKDTLAPGKYTVMYKTTDKAGLAGMASFTLTVRDTIKPKAICQPTLTIFANPAGFPIYSLQASQINNGSTDNCSPSANLTYALSPNTFNCLVAGSNSIVKLTVTDTSGNSAACLTIVRVENERPLLSYTPVCEGGTLQLICTTPVAAPNTFTYQWNGPDGFSSNLQNPIVTTNAMSKHNGTYCVTITGATGCTSSACIVVNLAILTNAPVLMGNGVSFCQGQNVVLMTNSYNGQNVSYQWLQDTPGGLIVLGTTTTLTTFTVPSPAPGNYTYYLKVFANGCNTALSNSFTVTVHPTPPAAVDPAVIKVCEGLGITLNSTTPSTGGLLTYMWSHPNGWTSNAQSPTVTNSAVKSQHEGVYTLITKQNGCLSVPVTVTVTVDSMPPRPIISSGNPNLCEGQPLTLVCNNLNAAQYAWTLPNGATVTTNFNSLSIPSVALGDSGVYTVLVSANGCFSNESVGYTIGVHPYPIVTASSNAPICKDSLLQLMATFSSVQPLTWCWTFPDGSSQFVQNLAVPNGASGTYQVVGKTSFGCADTATVQVTNSTPPSITFIGNNAPACCDGTTDAVLTAIVVPQASTYLWTGPAAFNSSTLPSPVIADVCTTYNGQYTLVVKDSIGCPSVPATTEINIQAPPATPILLVNPTQPVCAGTDVLLSITLPTPGATYLWNRPGSFSDTTTTTAWLSILNAQVAHSGAYSVIVISGNGTCQSGSSAQVTLTVNPIPATPIISSTSPACEGGSLSLMADSQMGDYHWIGPGFDSPMQNPVLAPVTLSMAGTYTLKVTKDNCVSPEATLEVMVVPTPNTPVIIPPSGPICIDSPVSSFINIANPENGMVYTWEDQSSGVVLQSSTATSLSLALPNVLALGSGPHTFWVQASTPAPESCESAYSNTVTVVFDTIPANISAYAGVDRPACTDSSIILYGGPNPLQFSLTGLWTQIGGPPVQIFNATNPTAWFMGVAGQVDTFQWTLSNGACNNFSSDVVIISPQSPEIADGGPDIYSCDLTGIKLNATQGANVQGKWTQLGSQASLGVVINNPNDPKTTISGLPGKGQTYSFRWEIGNPGCGVNTDPVVVYVYSPKPSAGPIQFVCDDENKAILQASELAKINGVPWEIGKWSSHDPGLTFSNPNLPSTTVFGLKPGKNEIFWTINNDSCGTNSRDTVEVFYEIFPQAIADVVSVPFGGTAEFNVLLNDVLPGAFTFLIATPPPLGRLIDTLAAVGGFVYRPQSGFTGSETMTYTISNNNCPGSISIGTVTFVVGGAPDCYIPTIITPNGDGFNDLFTIPEVCTLGEGSANLDVTVYNQWGDVVFHAKPYQNDWGGTYNSEDLPAGTYFYRVQLNDADKPLAGFLLIQR